MFPYTVPERPFPELNLSGEDGQIYHAPVYRTTIYVERSGKDQIRIPLRAISRPLVPIPRPPRLLGIQRSHHHPAKNTIYRYTIF